MAATDLNPVLLEAESYRDFLKKAFQQLKKENPRFNYASFARRAGFSSRSVPKDVESGYRRMTPAAFSRFAQAFGLRGESKTYFELLVALEEPDVHTGRLSNSEIRAKLGRLKQSLQVRQQLSNPSEVPDIFKLKHWQELYAAMGTEEKGATLAEIVARTKISEAICKTNLERLCVMNVATFEPQSQSYFSKSLHIAFDHLGKDLFFKQTFLDLSQSVIKDAKVNFHLEDRLFFNSAFSVNSRDLPGLKKELRELLLRFIVDAEKAEGDQIAKLVVGLTPNG